jgi:hypothetical protein
MDKSTLEKMALTNFANLNTARAALFAAAEKAIYLDMTLDGEKSAAILSGKIDGKNEEARKAQIKDILSERYLELAIAQNGERRARFDYEQALTEVDTVKTLLRIAELSI